MSSVAPTRTITLRPRLGLWDGMSWPEVATLAVIFMLYINAPVVAVRYHGVPYAVGALSPLPLLIPLTYFIIFRAQRVILTPVIPLIILFAVIQLIGVAMSDQPDVALGNAVSTLIEGVALYLIITNVIRSPQMLRRAIWALLLAGAFMGGLGLTQELTGAYGNNFGGFAQASDAEGFGVETSDGVVRQRRQGGPIGEKNRYAQLLLMLVPLGIMRFQGERSAWLKSLAGIAATLATVGCILAFSRGAAVGFALMVLLMTGMRYVTLRQLASLTLGTAIMLWVFPQYASRLFSLQSAISAAASGEGSGASLDGAIRGRFTEALAAVRVFADHPVIGVGPGMFRFYSAEYGNEGGLRALEGTRQAHNLYLQIAAEHGILGLTCFLGMLGLTFRRLAVTRHRYARSNPDVSNMATAFILVLATYMTTGLFLHFSFVRFFWLMFALAGSASHVATAAKLVRVRVPAQPLRPRAQSSATPSYGLR